MEYLRLLAMNTSGEAKGGKGMLTWIQKRMGDEEGQALVEYTLIISLIAVVCILALTATGQSLSGIFNSIAGQV
jgi:pilus assembly protein Flp/PilA